MDPGIGIQDCRGSSRIGPGIGGLSRSECMMLAFFDNNDAAHGVATYGKDGQSQLRMRILVDCGANVLCINLDVATDCPLPLVSSNTHIKTFEDN